MDSLQREISTEAHPLFLEYTSESMERQRQEELYRPPSRILQWCIAPLVFLATMIPASVLLIQILQVQNRQARSMQHGIMLIPTLSVGIDVMGVGVVLVSIMGLLGVAKGCRHLMNLYFALVLCFIAVQVGNAIIGFMSGSSWIQEALQKSWDKAYHTDRSLIRDLQTEFHCQGFLTREDRAATMSLDPEIYLPPCAQFLYMRFGKRLQRLGSIIFCIRLIQLTGVFLLSILFKHLATMDPTDEDEQERTDGESPFFKSEKQIEDEIARAPLLAGEDDDLPHYSVGDYYGSEEYDVESDEDEDGSGGSCDEDDEHQQYRGRFFYGCFGARDYEYRDLPDYAEDKRETQPL